MIQYEIRLRCGLYDLVLARPQALRRSADDQPARALSLLNHAYGSTDSLDKLRSGWGRLGGSQLLTQVTDAELIRSVETAIRAGSVEATVVPITYLTRSQPRGRSPSAAGEADVTEAQVRAAMRHAHLKCQQGSVSLPTIRKYVQMLRQGQVPPAIKVHDGIIVEGNHRYIAGRIFKKEPPIQEWLGGRAERVVPWDQVVIDEVEW